MPIKPGDPERVDGEYPRHGTAALFMVCEPLAGQRHVFVRAQRKRADFAAVVKTFCDEFYPAAEKVVLVMDQLNTHGVASLYAAFPPPEARRLAERLEIHHSPKHGSWLNMAEIELSVLVRQCLAERMDNQEHLTEEVAAWEHARNAAATRIDWRFTTADARKLRVSDSTLITFKRNLATDIRETMGADVLEAICHCPHWQADVEAEHERMRCRHERRCAVC